MTVTLWILLVIGTNLTTFVVAVLVTWLTSDVERERWRQGFADGFCTARGGLPVDDLPTELRDEVRRILLPTHRRRRVMTAVGGVT
jgi:hypothetical protein